MLADLVGRAARRHGPAVAYAAATGWRLTYRALDRLSDEVAGGLARRGVGPGDVVALVLPPCPDFVVAYAAAAKLGAVTAGINARLTGPERAACLDAVAPAVVLGDDVVPAEHDAGCLTALRVAGYEPSRQADDPERPVAIVFTSGSTGAPKAATFAGRQLAAITAIDTGWRWGHGGAALAGTTFAHLGPMTKLPGGLLRGATTHVLERWTAKDALAVVERERVAALGGIPTQLALMVSEPGFAARDVSSVQAVVMGGGPATPALVRACRGAFGAPVSTRYSCTEAGIGTGTGPADPPEDAEQTVGRPQPGVEVLVLDGDDRPVVAGAVGSVCFRSPATMTGYWGAPTATAAATTATGAVRTGDLGWIDDAGRLRLVGRARDMYVRGGENVFPVEVEAVLASAPGVGQVVVVPRPDDTWGEVGVAVVVPEAGAPRPSLADLRAHAAPLLARFKLPDALLVVDALPLTPMEKVDRRAAEALVTSAGR